MQIKIVFLPTMRFAPLLLFTALVAAQSSSLSFTSSTRSISRSSAPTAASTVVRLSSSSFLPSSSSAAPSSTVPSSTTPSASSSSSPTPPPIVLVRRSILHHFFPSFCLAGHSSRPCLWRSRWYSYPLRSPLRVLGPQKQMVRLSLTYQPPYFLTRLCRTSFFLAGFYTLSLACSVLIIRYGVLPAVNPPSKTLRGMFVLASVITGFAGGGVAIFFWKATRYCIGAWGGFAFALFIQCFHSGGVIRPIGYRWILYIGKSVCQQITSPI